MKFTDERDRLEAIAEYADNLVRIIRQPRRDTAIGEATHSADYIRAVDLLEDAIQGRAGTKEGDE